MSWGGASGGPRGMPGDQGGKEREGQAALSWERRAFPGESPPLGTEIRGAARHLWASGTQAPVGGWGGCAWHMAAVRLHRSRGGACWSRAAGAVGIKGGCLGAAGFSLEGKARVWAGSSMGTPSAFTPPVGLPVTGRRSLAEADLTVCFAPPHPTCQAKPVLPRKKGGEVTAFGRSLERPLSPWLGGCWRRLGHPPHCQRMSFA